MKTPEFTYAFSSLGFSLDFHCDDTGMWSVHGSAGSWDIGKEPFPSIQSVFAKLREAGVPGASVGALEECAEAFILHVSVHPWTPERGMRIPRQLSRRDQFALVILQANLAKGYIVSQRNAEQIARDTYDFADEFERQADKWATLDAARG